MKRPTSPLLGAILIASGAIVAPVQAQWNQNASVGPFDYANSANWVGGGINNQFTSTPASGLNITFSADYTFSSQVTLGWGSNPNVTFRSDSATPRTLKLNGDFVRTNFTGGIVTLGTVANPLILDLNGATRQIGGAVSGGSGSVNSTNNIYAQIVDSSGGNHGVTLSRGLTYCYLLNDNNSFSGPVSFTGSRGGGFTSIKNIWGGPSSLGAPTDTSSGTISIADQKSFGELAYLGAGDTSDRPFQWNLGASSYSFANKGSGKLTLTGPWTLSGVALTLNAASNHIELDGYLQGSSTNTSLLRIQGGTAKQVFLTNPNNTFQAVEVDSGVLAYNNIADPGVPCALGTGANIILAGGALQWVGASATNTRPLLFTNAGPFNVENAAASTLTLSADFTGAITDYKIRTINLNVGNASTLAVQGAIGDLAYNYNPTTIVAGGAAGITLANGGTVQLLNPANSFSGGVQVKYGRTLQVVSLADNGQSCSIGTGTSPLSGQSAITLGSTDSQRGGTLAYIGTTDASCDRVITVLGSVGGQASATILNNSPNNSSLHLSNPNPWTFDLAGSSVVMSNCAVVLGGTAAANNILDAIIPNTSLGNARLTVGGSTWVLTSAQQYLGTTTVTNGTLLLQSSASIPQGGDVTVQSDGTLGGLGTIYENVTVLANGTLSPGMGDIGMLTIVGNLTNNGSLVMKLNKAGNRADQIRGINTLTYGGTLVVTNLVGTLAAGDSFQLFQASRYVGTFSAISPVRPGADLAWDLSRLNTGVLGVVSSSGAAPPQITQFRIVPGGTMVFSSTTNSANAYRTGYLLMSTNLVNWTCIRTNGFDASGCFSITNALDTRSAPRQFFLLKVQ
jgi:fibronectin-binding autotransporter adhesin